MFRTASLQSLQFSLLARVSDCQKLRACDVSEVVLDGSPALAVTFRTSKSDVRFKGATSYIVKVGGPFCAYTVLKTYMDIFGFKMASTEIKDTSYLLCRSQSAGGGHFRYKC